MELVQIMGGDFVYDSQGIAERINLLLKTKKLSQKIMLEECGLNKNTIFTMRRGSIPKADSLAKIADYLGCSVDYLLGKTAQLNPSGELPEQTAKFLSLFQQLTDEQQALVIASIEGILQSRKE